MNPGQGFLNPPGPLTGASDAVFWIFAGATFAMVAGSVLIAGLETYRRRSALPLVVLASATLWLPNEPFVDAILGFQYAADAPGTLWVEAGRPIPVSALGIGAMFSMFTWLVFRLVVAGTPTRRIVGVAVVAGIIDWPLEMLAIHANVFEYYGDNPSRILGLPWTSMVQNCFLYVFMGSVLALSAPHLKGWRSLLFLPALPGCYFAVAFLCTWPAYLALHTGAAPAVFVPLALVSAALNVWVPLAVLGLAQAQRRPARGPAEGAAVPAGGEAGPVVALSGLRDVAAERL